jgi:hypothetical protein
VRIAAAVNELSRALYGEDELTSIQVGQWFDTPDLDMLVAQLEDGRIAGYADLTDHRNEHSRFWIDLRVPPAEHGPEVTQSSRASPSFVREASAGRGSAWTG